MVKQKDNETKKVSVQIEKLRLQAQKKKTRQMGEVSESA